METITNSTKGHYWGFVIFEDNIEQHPDWLKRCLSTHMRFCVSPYHDQDIWDNLDLEQFADRNDIDIGKPKKKHYHVMFHSDENTTFKSFKDMIYGLNIGVTNVWKIFSPYGMYVYFWHGDNPEKHQYDCNDVKNYNGSEPQDYLMEITKFKKAQIIKELIAFMRTKRYIKMCDFLLELSTYFEDPIYGYIAQNNMNIFREILKDNLADCRTSIMAEARKMQ